MKRKRYKTRGPKGEQFELPEIPKTVAIYYKDRREVRDALRNLAVKRGHNSIGKLLRQATRMYLAEHDPVGDWKLASNGG